MGINNVQIEESWKSVLSEEFNKPYFHTLVEKIKEDKRNGKTIYPNGKLIFNAFNTTPFQEVKVVILGQDPYHGPGQAMGLSFSVPKNIKIPPSLRNIYKELNRSVSFTVPAHGDLTSWASQGVFLLNVILTVEKSKPRSHSKYGWEEFTNAVIKTLSYERDGVVFLLWGNFARKKKEFIDSSKHLILESVHPSPLAGNGFQGNNHFSTTNHYLTRQNKAPINWTL